MCLPWQQVLRPLVLDSGTSEFLVHKKGNSGNFRLLCYKDGGYLSNNKVLIEPSVRLWLVKLFCSLANVQCPPFSFTSFWVSGTQSELVSYLYRLRISMPSDINNFDHPNLLFCRKLITGLTNTYPTTKGPENKHRCKKDRDKRNNNYKLASNNLSRMVHDDSQSTVDITNHIKKD